MTEQAAATGLFPQIGDASGKAPPCAMVLFGAAGDLTKRLVVPALYNLVVEKRLSDDFQLVGVDLVSKSSQEWRDGLAGSVKEFVGAEGEYEIKIGRAHV